MRLTVPEGSLSLFSPRLFLVVFFISMCGKCSPVYHTVSTLVSLVKMGGGLLLMTGTQRLAALAIYSITPLSDRKVGLQDPLQIIRQQ